MRAQATVVGLAMLIAGCDAGHSDATAPGARSLAPARFALSAAVQSLDATAVSVNVFYVHGTQQVTLASTTVALPVTAPTSLSVDLSPCLTDPGRVPLAQGTCAISADLVLLKGTAELDHATVGPVDAKAGQDVTLPQATLHEVSTVTIASPSGGALSFEPETTVVLTASAKDNTGANVTGLTLSWSSSNPAVATIDSISGALTTVAPGTTTVTATIGGRSASVPVQVVPFAVHSVTVSGPASIPVGQSVQLTAAYFDRKGRPLSGRTVSWSSNNASVATVSSTGSVTGVAAGTATITATVDTVSGALGISVIRAVVASVGVALGNSTLHVGQSTQATATAFDAAGNTLAGRTVSNWSSSNPTVASVSATGVITAISLGTVTISATVEGVTGTSGTLTVSLVPVATVAVTLDSPSLYVRQTTGATAVARDSAGNVLTGRVMGAWQSSNSKVAQVNANGLVTAVGAGTALISTTIDNVPGAAVLTVTVSPVATVSDSLASSEIAIDQTTQAGAIALSATGAVITGLPVTWSSSNTAIATVSSTGLVTGVGAGQATITATVAGVSGSTSVFVYSNIGFSP